MGHDFITYGDRHVHVRDIDIWTLRHFLCREASDAAPNEVGIDEATLHSLCGYFENWNWIGPGVVTGTDLSEFIRENPQRLRAVVRIIDRTIARVKAFGDVIPLEYLQQHVNTETAWFMEALPTERFVRALERLREILS